MQYIIEPEKRLPICEEVDLCVIGGSCTGLFAAVRAARLGLRVALIEKQNCLGGMATAGLVNIWHSLHDFYGEEQIIGGLTFETIQRLEKNGAVMRGRPRMSLTGSTQRSSSLHSTITCASVEYRCIFTRITARLLQRIIKLHTLLLKTSQAGRRFVRAFLLMRPATATWRCI